MKRLVLPGAPQLTGLQPAQQMTAITNWMAQTKTSLETTLNAVASTGTATLTVTAYTTSTTLTGTSSLASVANTLCTLIAILQNKGMLASPKGMQ